MDTPGLVRLAWDSWLANGRISNAVRLLQNGMLAGGGRLLTLSAGHSAADQVGASHLDELRQRGAEVRVHQAELPDVIVLDRCLAILRGHTEHGQAEVYVIRHPGVVEGFTKLLTTVWSTAVDLALFRRIETGQDGLAVHVLALLGAGYKDETAARELGMSVRTYRRHVASLMRRLDANSRFQAGMQAARLGL